jgi:hypothetical protein
VNPDPKHWLKIFEKTDIFRENYPGNNNFSRKFLRNEISRNFEWANFRLFSLFAKRKKGVLFQPYKRDVLENRQHLVVGSQRLMP